MGSLVKGREKDRESEYHALKLPHLGLFDPGTNKCGYKRHLGTPAGVWNLVQSSSFRISCTWRVRSKSESQHPTLVRAETNRKFSTRIVCRFVEVDRVGARVAERTYSELINYRPCGRRCNKCLLVRNRKWKWWRIKSWWTVYFDSRLEIY